MLHVAVQVAQLENSLSIDSRFPWTTRMAIFKLAFSKVLWEKKKKAFKSVDILKSLGLKYFECGDQQTLKFVYKAGIQIRSNEADTVQRIHKCCLLCKAVYRIQSRVLGYRTVYHCKAIIGWLLSQLCWICVLEYSECQSIFKSQSLV